MSPSGYQTANNEPVRSAYLRAGVWICLGLLLIGVSFISWQNRLILAHPGTILLPLADSVHRAPIRAAGLFLLVEIIVTSLAIPIEGLMAVAAGALFGFVEGVVLVSVSASVGATISLLLSRWLLRDVVRRKFPRQVERVDKGLQRDGVAYLYSLRLLPLFPFPLVNILMSVTTISARVFFLVSLISMVPAIALYVNAGTQLAKVKSLSDVVSPAMILALFLLGTFPWIVKSLVWLWQRARRS